MNTLNAQPRSYPPDCDLGYRTLEENLHNMGFVRGTNNKGEKISWRWQVKADNGSVMLLELLVDDPEMGARVRLNIDQG